MLYSLVPAFHGGAVALGLYKLLVVPTGNIWSPEIHKFDEVLLS